MYSWDHTINHNENEDENEIDHIDTTQIDQGVDMEANIVNRKSVLVTWCLYVLSKN